MELELGELLQEFDAVAEESESSWGNSLNASVEELSTAGTTTAQKKLGDTTDLESFIENLDKELAM
uniref:Si:dkey-27i16.2 n=1 Tax=Astyanax mexicanus TaxID=7994 RepID=A0A3B1JZL3_ASTMX